jgi:hypothetical protein
MTYARKFATDCKNFLGIVRPVRLKIIRSELHNEDWEAYCQTHRDHHRIVVSRHASRGLLTVIAHELVHAAIDEQFHEHKNHGKRFRSLAGDLYVYLKRRQYNVSKLYLKGVDTD